MALTITSLSKVIVAGDDYIIVFTLTKDGNTYDITGSTITCSLYPVIRVHSPMNDHAVVITTAVSGIATMTLLDTETLALLVTDSDPSPIQVYEFIGDVKVVEPTGDVVHSNPFSVEVRYPATQEK